MIETDRQLQIVQQVRKAGGYARKQSNAYTSGIPDLHVIAPGFMPVDIEVKDLGQILPDWQHFNRKVATTRLQKETMEAMNKATGQILYGPETGFIARNTAAFVMVTYKRGKDIYVASLPATATCINSEDLPCVTRLNELHLTLPQHLKAMGVPTL